MKTVSVDEATTTLLALLADVAAGEDVVIARDGTPVARLVPAVVREPGALRHLPGWRDFDPHTSDLFKPLETDEELAAEGWPV